MKFTNKFDLPPELVRILTAERYIPDEEDFITDYSITTLISPVQQVILKRRYPDCNTEDVSDRLWALLGSVMHSLLEEHASENAITEKRFYKQILGRTISGMTDHYCNNVISDYKMTKAYKIIRGEYDDWEAQLNCYATLVEDYGHKVDSLRIQTIIRDFSKHESYKKNYPKHAMPIIPLTLWSKEKRERFMEERVRLLIENEDVPDDMLPKCTSKEKWQDFKDWYVLKTGNQVGRCFKTREEATKFAADGDFTITQRFTSPRRCEEYCSVSSKCCQRKEECCGIVKSEPLKRPGFGTRS